MAWIIAPEFFSNFYFKPPYTSALMVILSLACLTLHL